MDAVHLLWQCVKVELGAALIYQILADRFRVNPEFSAFWRSMAGQEREHAHKLDTWRQILEHSADEKRPPLDGFAEGVAELERLVRELSKRATRARNRDEAFSIALELETSELDTIYTTLLQGSPIARFPDIEDTRRVELGKHHAALLAEVRKSSNDDRNRLLAAILEATH